MFNDWFNPTETKEKYFACDDCGDLHTDFALDEHFETGKYLCKSCMKKQREKDDDLANEKADKMETIAIKVEPAQIGFNSFGWMAYSEQLGGIDYSCENGEDWSNCGSPQGTGVTIQDAIDDFLDMIEETKFTWS